MVKHDVDGTHYHADERELWECVLWYDLATGDPLLQDIKF